MGISLISGFDVMVFVVFFISVALAYLFQEFVIPRGLSGLQVAFPTGAKRYEVHTVTNTKYEARDLLRAPGMRYGLTVYIMAFTGAIVLGLEWLFYQTGINDGIHMLSLSIALILIIFPAMISTGVSMSMQLITPAGIKKATLQGASTFRSGVGITITILWFTSLFLLWYIMGIAEISFDRRLAITGCLAFAPGFVAYGRVLGSSWTALAESSRQLSKGEPSAFYPYKPDARKQFVAMLVWINTAAMPLIALNTLVSLIFLAINPEMFVHSDAVYDLPEYRPQTTIMEEGGIVGFYAIELFSNISEPGIRVPLVTLVLLFLLLNVAVVGFLFVYEVARILFLDIADVAGKGGIKLADSRLLRSERNQQANVLNFCFTGFAGQSMLLLALAMLTFWDSQYLPQGSECGSWQDSICGVLRKDALEELTWMLAAGGQVVFLGIWALSRRTGQRLGDVTFDAMASQNRSRLEAIQSIIYREGETITKAIIKDEWSTALDKMERLYEDHGEEGIEGLSLVKRTEASMILLTGLGNWDQAEEVALSYLALQTGRTAEIAKGILSTTSIAQRDVQEAIPRIKLLPKEDIEAARLRWFTSLFDTSQKLSQDIRMMLKMDSVTKLNISLLKRYKDGVPVTSQEWKFKPADKLHILGEIARFRIWGQSDIALDKLESWADRNKVVMENWPHGQTARALLYIDRGLMATAAKIVQETMENHPRHPHLRRLAIYLSYEGKMNIPSPEPTGLIWADTKREDWKKTWPTYHNVVPAPEMANNLLKAHAWSANAWVIRKELESHKISDRAVKKMEWPTQPFANHLILTGLITTVGGIPVDLGLPGTLNFKAIEKADLLDL